MLKVLFDIFDKYGLDTLQLGIIGFFGWKLFTNHLAHIAKDIKSIMSKVDNVEKDLNSVKERVSHIEGQLEH